MLNLGELVSTVQRNCHISDAQYAGEYTLCVFLLKMREFYRWEHRIPFAGVLPSEEIGRWMQERERMWETLETRPFESLALPGLQVDPFDTATINRALLPQGHVYSAGIGRFNKPHFFLGALQHSEQREGVTIHVSRREYARDLVAPPAMMLDNIIYLRQESLRRFLWERIEEWRLNNKNEAMSRAIADYGFDDDLDAALDRMTEAETESVVLHELGEAFADRRLGPAWPEMLAALARSKAEIQVRAVRDLLADCLSTLPGLIARNLGSALHFYFANFTDMRRQLFPEAMRAYHRWCDGNSQALAHLVRDHTSRWLDTAHALLALHQKHGADTAAHIELFLDNPPACQIPAAR